MEGYLTKRGHRFKTWRKRWFVLESGKLSYFEDEGGKSKGCVELFGSKVEFLSASDVDRPFCAKITPAAGEELIICAETRADLHEWASAIRRASVSVRGSISDGALEGAEPASLTAAVSSSAIDLTGFVMPSKVRVIGIAEEGSELRIWVPEGDSAIGLCRFAWYRAHPAAARFLDPNEVGKLSGTTYILDASKSSYTLTASDVGSCIGCVVQSPVDPTQRLLGVCKKTVVAVDPSMVSVTIRILPHNHSKYCDRRSRVCTATGRYREGEVLQAVLRGPSAEFHKYKIQWYHSKAPVTSYADSSYFADSETVEAEPDAKDFKRKTSLLAYEGEADAELIGYNLVFARPVCHLPPAPADHERSPTLEEVRTRPPPPPEEPDSGFFEYPIFKEDVHYMIRCSALLKPEYVTDAAGFTVAPKKRNIFSLPVGPVEPGPPAAREVWIEGNPFVGATLCGRVYYFGGTEGRSRCWWTRINAEGDATDATPAVEIPSPAGLDQVLLPGDPRVYTVTAADVGCMLKFKYHPIRVDGRPGHQMTSRPTPVVTESPMATPSGSPLPFDGPRLTPRPPASKPPTKS